jgi:predicted DNA-binding transcriptional regulator YafY
MARSENQKLKLLYLLKILMEETDEEHYITMPEIIKKLESYDVKAERKSIYNDISYLKDFGVDLVGEKFGSSHGYYIASRDFELSELKLLVDAVQSAKFITAKQSDDLIKKLEALVSRHEAKQLQREVFVAERVKTDSHKTLYNVDTLHSAISNNSNVSFKYWQWDVHKKMVPKHGGKIYNVSPWALSWDDENYYLVGFDVEAGKIKHFRVDKMMDIAQTQEPRRGREEYDKQDMASSAKRIFGMFNGYEETVQLYCKDNMAGVIIDRFGKDVMIVPKGKGYFQANVKVSVSGQFFGWVLSLGEDVKIIGPQRVVEDITKRIEKLGKLYK